MQASDQENEYTDFAAFYDSIMLAGYYDYDQQIAALSGLIPAGAHVLEIGVGTGLLAEKLVARGFKVAGMDHTAEMVALARERLGASVDLYQADARNMQLPDTYDCIVSNGGVWYGVVDKVDGGYRYCGHLTQVEDILASIQTVCRHLKPAARLILSTQDIHRNLSLDLPGGGKYTQVIEPVDSHTFKKDYIKQAGGAEQRETLYLTYIDRDVFEGEMAKHGFAVGDVAADDKYIVFERGA